MKNELIKNITNTMKELLLKNKKDELYLNKEDCTIKYDTKNEFIFISLSCEDLTDACYTTYCDSTLFEDVSMYDLECLDDYDENDLKNIFDILCNFNGNN